MPEAGSAPRFSSRLLGVGLLGILACAPARPACPRCDTLVIAAVGEPDHLVPPLVWSSAGRDVMDLIFERLAALDPSRSPLDTLAFRPRLADRWERLDSVTWRFHLRSGATWHDGRPVTADDVVFSFRSHLDPALDAVARGSIEGLRVTAETPATVRIAFDAPRPDQLYDATWHVRIFPRHLWDSIPPDRWGGRTDPAMLIGSGPYRLRSWERGAWLELGAVDSASRAVRRVIWRFAASPDAAANLVLSGEADLLETILDPARRPEFERNGTLGLVPYPSSVYGYLGFNLAKASAWQDVRVRRALALALDRPALARAIFGPETRVPAGPMSGQLWLWGENREDQDTARALTLLADAGWRRDGSGRLRRAGRPLAIDVLVPATSATRRNLAVAVQERWSRLGIAATVTAVDFPVFQERLARGRFDGYIGAWLDEPHPRSLQDQWGRSGWGRQNYGRYASPAFDSLFALALAAADTAASRRWWSEALDTLNGDAPAIWLYTPSNVAVVHRRVALTRFRPFAWLEELPAWRARAE